MWRETHNLYMCLYVMVLRTRLVLPVLNIVSRNDKKTVIIINLLKSVVRSYRQQQKVNKI
jgi:hypothetical protein